MTRPSSEGRVTAAQDVLSNLVGQVNDLCYSPLGPKFALLRGRELSSSLIAYRLGNKFVKADSCPVRANMSIQTMLLYDNTGPTGAFDWFAVPKGTRMNLVRAKHEIAKLLSKFKLPETATRFPTGESSVSSNGEISFAAKFSSDLQWTCGPGSLVYAGRLCYNTPPLKKMVRERWSQLYPASFQKHTGHGFESFLLMFRQVVDIETGRITTVPKDTDSDRVISMEPTFSMIAQLQLSAGLRKCLVDEWHYDLNHRADLHGKMISWGPEWATIDLKNASNSNWTAIIEALWPPSVVKLLKKFRSENLTYVDTKGVTQYVTTRMLSPMGNGFTFEVMTITLLAMARVFDPAASVFGDDIVIRKGKNKFLRMLHHTNWVVNTKKTFLRGGFRESCGFFYDVAERYYIKSFDLHYPKDDMDAIVAANKLYILLERDEMDRDLRGLVLTAYAKLLQLYIDFATHPRGELCSDGVFSPRVYGLPVNRSFDNRFEGQFWRRPVWRYACKVKDAKSEVRPHEWVSVASSLLGNPVRAPRRDDRRLHIEIIDDMSDLTHSRFVGLTSR